MGILNKYKEEREKGFKDFVRDLDIVPLKAAKEMIINGLFEDPVYLKSAIENRIGFDYFTKLSKNEILAVFNAFPKSSLVFLYSLKNHPAEYDLVNNNLPSMVIKQYFEDRETAKVTVALQENARSKIMEAVYKLREEGELGNFEWKLPSSDVLNGKHFSVDASKSYKQYYEEGGLALTGTLDIKNNRTGIWKNFYPNGAIHAEGVYVDGKKQDEWKIYFLNGKIKSLGLYKNDLKNGEWKEFENNDKNEFKIINYVNGKVV